MVLLVLPGHRDPAPAFRRGRGAAHHAGMIWVCWPKRASGLQTDLDENVGPRDYGLAHGQVDVKVAAIDATWSGSSSSPGCATADRARPRESPRATAAVPSRCRPAPDAGAPSSGRSAGLHGADHRVPMRGCSPHRAADQPRRTMPTSPRRGRWSAPSMLDWAAWRACW